VPQTQIEKTDGDIVPTVGKDRLDHFAREIEVAFISGCYDDAVTVSVTTLNRNGIFS
jgi:hypothetical protein